MSDFHTRVSPSALERVLACPGSVALSATVPEPKPTRFAAEGTVFHNLAKMCLTFGFDPYDFLGQTHTADGFDFEIEEDMLDYLVAGLDELEALSSGAIKQIVETRVYLDKWLPGQSGTLDFGAITENGIIVWDWKYGAGIPVHPRKNPQLMAYALGLWDQWARKRTKATKFRLVIHQPRHPSGGGEWTCELDDLLFFGKRIAPIVADAIKGSDKFNPGEKQCTFCPARGVCPAYDKYSLELMQMEFEDLDAGKEKPKLISQMTMKRRSYIVQHADMLKKWIEDQHQKVMEAALLGETTHGLKAVYGRAGKRSWSDQDKVANRLRKMLDNDKVFVQKLVSPAQVEKLLTEDQFRTIKPLVYQSDPKPILVPEGDKRQAIKPVADDFEDLTQE
jgi:hypothetical protein